MDNNVTVLFSLSEGKISDGHRSAWNVTSFVVHEHVQVALDPTREDLGVGPVLDNPQIVAVHVAWLDDYNDNKEPVLAITGTYRTAPLGTPDVKSAVQLMPDAISVPYFPTGSQIMEWIATYMHDNVYHDGMDVDS